MIDGHRSSFPVSLDNWGQEFVNDTGQPVWAADWNKIQDAILKLEQHTLKLVKTGDGTNVTHALSGLTRPTMLLKSYLVTATGSAATTKTFSLSGFTLAEKALFSDGMPLAPSGAIHVQIRKAGGDANPEHAYHGGVASGLTDYSGDSGWNVIASTLRHGNNDFTINAGAYVITVLIQSSY